MIPQAIEPIEEPQIMTLDDMLASEGLYAERIITRDGFTYPHDMPGSAVANIGEGSCFKCYKIELGLREYALLIEKKESERTKGKERVSYDLNYCFLDAFDLNILEGICSVVTTHAIGVSRREDGKEKNVFLLQDYLPGQDMRKVIEDSKDGDGNVSVTYATRIVWLSQGLLTLQKFQQEGYIHRDIKPDNFVINGARATLVDIGVLYHPSKITVPSPKGSTLGSAPYMSPEQAKSLKMDSRSDIFGWGVTAAEIFKVPGLPIKSRIKLEGGSSRRVYAHEIIAENDIRPPRGAYNHIPEALQEPIKKAIDTALEGNPRKRKIHLIRKHLEAAYNAAAEHGL